LLASRQLVLIYLQTTIWYFTILMKLTFLRPASGLFLLSLLCAPTFAQTPNQAQPPADVAATELDQVLVTGEQPGPGLWKVSKDDHVLWILGTLAPLPKKMSWRSKDTEAVIADSQEVIGDSSAKINVGFFRGLTLVPSLLRARKNPDGAKLKDVLSAEQYARWSALKAKYIGRDNGIESRRPMLAAQELYEKAVDRSGLSSKNAAWDVVKQAAKKNKIPVTSPKIDIELDDPKATIKEFETTPVAADIACLETTMQRIETDMQSMQLRANAWASGDLNALRSLPYPDQKVTCLAAVSSAPGLRDRVQQVQERMVNAWMTAVQTALAKNRSTLAVVSIAELVKPNGRLARLRALGYTVEEPQ
jgi:uncharacterized protein YbaP (TraB family)